MGTSCWAPSGPVQHCKDFTYRFADGVRQQRFGAVTPGYNFMLTLREGIEEILPTEAHSLATDRLYVSITHSESGTNHNVSTFTSREELIKVLLASCFVPVYAGLKPVELRGKKWIDGGFTDSLPILPVGRTITVSPFAGRQDVCPTHRGRFKTQLRLANMNILVRTGASDWSVRRNLNYLTSSARLFSTFQLFTITEQRVRLIVLKICARQQAAPQTFLTL
ncbi:patatin-like phospholipase domain-containing protein 4 isoform X3 [Pelmatolapia mariae]|uniref:patatin-like phospholipase domain-containing protein 4 isoform X3 n=1 Tax=Pelmatolapia mariae TaxID=158779 RepID=UPI002FE582F6